jgi:hypothetical protein
MLLDKRSDISAERYDGITLDRSSSRRTSGRSGGHDLPWREDRRGSVIGAGTVVAQDVPPLSVVTGAGSVERKRLKSLSATGLEA